MMSAGQQLPGEFCVLRGHQFDRYLRAWCRKRLTSDHVWGFRSDFRMSSYSRSLTSITLMISGYR